MATYGERAPSPATSAWWCKECVAVAKTIMVAEIDKRVAGVQPIQFFAYQDQRNCFIGAMLTGVAVHPAYRRRGVFLELVKACELTAWNWGAEFVVTMPNERSLPGFIKLGYVDLGQRRLLARIIDPKAFGAKLPTHLGFLVGAGISALQGLINPRRKALSHETSEILEVPSSIEQLEAATACQFPGLRMQRNKSWWDWRYRQCPDRQYRLFAARDRTGNVSGFATTTYDVRRGLRIGYLMDLAVANSAVFNDLIAGLMENVGAFETQLLCAVVSSSEQIKALCRNGFWLVPHWVPAKRFHTVARFNPARINELPVRWQSISGWYQTLGDWDNL
jgi:GNAT superfamily N-acetyltransferase